MVSSSSGRLSTVAVSAGDRISATITESAMAATMVSENWR
jgi:hypothetical protein